MTTAPIKVEARMKGRRRPMRLLHVSDQLAQTGSRKPSISRGKACAQPIKMGLSLNSSGKICITRKPNGMYNKISVMAPTL